jgi:hypothetical protein
MVKMTYVPNTIGVQTHGVDLRHHGLPKGRELQNHQWTRCNVKRGRGRKKEREKEKEESVPCFADKSCHLAWRDCFMSRTRIYGAICSTWHSAPSHASAHSVTPS